MLCNREEFQRCCQYEFIICYFVSHADCETNLNHKNKVGENRLRDQPKAQRGHRQTEKRRFIDLSAILKALCSVPCYFLAPDHMPRRSTVLMVSILSLFLVLYCIRRSHVLGGHLIRGFG